MEKHHAKHKGLKRFGSRNALLFVLLLIVFLPLFLVVLVQQQTLTQHAAIPAAVITEALLDSPTPTLQPVAASPVNGSAKLAVIVILDGIGQAGDSANHVNNTMSNKFPTQPQRFLSLILVDSKGQTVAAASGSVAYASDTGDFRGTVDLGSKFTPGTYTVKVKMQQYLVKTIAMNFNIAANTINTLPPAELVTGDIDGNNTLDISDYNAILSCLDKNGTQSNCQGKRRLEVDLNDDGTIGIQDINLLLREFSVKNGD